MPLGISPSVRSYKIMFNFTADLFWPQCPSCSLLVQHNSQQKVFPSSR